MLNNADAEISAAAATIRSRLPLTAPCCAIVLGSGLGGLASRVADGARLPYEEIPGFEPTHVAGHEGALIHGTLSGREVLLLAGRFHMYEGHSAERAAFPIRAVAALGISTLLLSNAAGGVRRSFEPGTLMVIADHINLMWRNPLIGPVHAHETRFPDMSAPYDEDLRTKIFQTANRLGIALQEGVYAGLLGPTYETPAEVRMLERLGADAVGMSTVPEVLVARALGMRVLGVSCITNKAAGLSPSPISHAEVVEVTRASAANFEALITALVAQL